MKKCCCCERELRLENFCKNKNHKDGLQSRCKKCQNELHKKYRLLNPEYDLIYSKEYRLKYPEKVRLSHKKWVDKNYGGIKKYSKKHYWEHVEYYKEHGKKYRSQHREDINLYRKNRKLINIQYKLSCLLRTRLNQAVRNNFKTGSAVRDLGCSISELKIYLENQFKEGMMWENHGEWHIDHKIPLKHFDLTNRDQLLKAVHYTNLQPLWAFDNISKNDKILEIYLEGGDKNE